MKTLIVAVHFALGLTVTRAADSLEVWHLRTSPTNVALNAVTFGNGLFVAVGDRTGPILTSTDGTTWSGQVTPANKDLSGVAYGNERFVAIGYAGRCLSSGNGADWTQQDTGTTANFNALRFVNGRFVAVGDGGAVYQSPNGANWTPFKTASTNYWLDVTYANGQYVAVGWDYKTAEAIYGVTPDLQTWQIGNSGYSRYLDSIVYVGQYLAVGYAGAAQTSTDGVAWTPSTQAGSRWLFDAAIGQDIVVAVGERGAMSSWTAKDHWVRRVSGFTKNLNGVAFGHNSFVAVGDNGTILQSDPVTGSPAALQLTNARWTDGRFEFQFNGEAGHVYRIEQSDDFKSWGDAGSVTCTSVPMTCQVPPGTPQRVFYRLVQDDR